MIFRLSQKLNTKIKAGTLQSLPLHENPFADWSAHLFVADRTQYIILSNTKSLYSVVMFGKALARSKSSPYGIPRDTFKALVIGTES